MTNKKEEPIPDDLGGQIRYLLNKHGLRTSFYCFVFAMVIVLVGLLMPYSLVQIIRATPGALFVFDAGPTLLIILGLYEIPFVKAFLADEVKKQARKK